MLRRPPGSPLFPNTTLFRSPGSVTPPQNGFLTAPLRGQGSFAFNTAGNREDTVKKPDRKSTRLNSSHSQISYAVFCLKKEKNSTSRRVTGTDRTHGADVSPP